MEIGAYKIMAENERIHWWFCGRRIILLSIISKLLKNQIGRALDIGCGTGGTMLDIKRFAQKVEGIDPSTEAINFAHSNYPDLNITKAKFPDELPSGKYDFITMFDVLEHIENDKAAIKALSELLLPRGFGVITVPAFPFLWSQHDEFLHHFRRYTIGKMKELISQNPGITIKHIHYYNSLLFLPIVFIRMLHKLFGTKSGSDDQKLPNKYVNKLLKNIFSLERFWLPIRSFPFGVSIICIIEKNK